MTRTTTHLAKAFETLWTLSMGLFLGLCGGLVLAVILTFKGTTTLKAVPGTIPYADPRFAAHHHDAVAGYIGQQFFTIGGIAALVLLGLAVLALLCGGVVLMLRLDSAEGSKWVSRLRSVAVVFCVLCMLKGASITADMNAAWPGLYDTSATDATIDQRRANFDEQHQLSEKVVGAAWFGGLIALIVSPWCRRPADTPLQSGDVKKEDN